MEQSQGLFKQVTVIVIKNRHHGISNKPTDALPLSADVARSICRSFELPDCYKPVGFAPSNSLSYCNYT